jgi:GTPase SAR1 family protein
VKVEVWDVVDVAKQLKKSDSLKISAEVTSTEGQSTALELDASTVDVMRGAHAVVMCYDPRKRWTWEYVERELPKIASLNVHVLVLETFRDIVLTPEEASAQDANRRQVSEDEARQFCELHGDIVSFAQASMKNCYGLKSVKTFLNFPFLAVQKQSYEAKLRRNLEETTQTREEFRVVSEEQTYDSYITFLTNRTKAVSTSGTSDSAPGSPLASPIARSGSGIISSPSSPQVTSVTTATTPNRTASAPIRIRKPNRDRIG